MEEVTTKPSYFITLATNILVIVMYIKIGDYCFSLPFMLFTCTVLYFSLIVNFFGASKKEVTTSQITAKSKILHPLSGGV